VKVAFVVQRYGTEVVGGAELHCRWVAEHLAARHRVEVLTTTATDYLTWRNTLPAGAAEVNGVPVWRFPVVRERREDDFFPVANKVCFFDHTDEEERLWLEEHGPVAPGLVEHLRRHEGDFDAIVFFSYRYWTTYFGMQVAPHKSLLVPTAEHDRVLYLRLFRGFFRLPAAIVFNTPEERDLIERVTGNADLPGEVVGTGIDRPAAVPLDEVAPRLDLLGDYLVYVGRIEPEKGCAVMIDHFLRWQRETRATTTLALFGRSTMSFSENAHVRLMGVVPDGEKLAAIARSRALVMPSRHESLSMVVLEAWMMERPVLVNGDCEVLRGQVLRANGGLYYRRYEEFAAAMDLLVSEPGLADRLGRQGHAYFRECYSWERVMEKYERLLERAASPPGPGRAGPGEESAAR
jgi:glycosyltransferase involved in cell wall biosynthesis